jgi:HPt (histidine-containing phosphotransfer) domain-containing protein
VPDPAPDILDLAALRRNFDGETDFLLRLLGKFEAAYPAQLARVREALARADGGAAAEEAHRLAGATSVFFAEAARVTALRTEDLARAGDVSAATAECDALERELVRLADGLRAMGPL